MMDTLPDLPATMNALCVMKFGPPSSMKYIEMPTPTIVYPTQVLVRIKAAGVNPVESKIRSGNVSKLYAIPAVLGSDYAGIIVGKGNQVDNFELGDEVFGSINGAVKANGTYAEYAVVDVKRDAIVKKPSSISFEEAAGSGIAAITAYEAIARGKLDTIPNTPSILIIGASGGVGSFAVQIAKAHDAYVTGICSTRNMEFVKGLGVDEVIDYTSPEDMNALSQVKETFDLIVDCVGGEAYYQKLNGALTKKGVYSTAVGPIKHVGSDKISLLDMIRVGGVVGMRTLLDRRYTLIVSLPTKLFCENIAPMLEKKKVRCVIPPGQVFQLKDGALAHEKINSLRTVGKIILTMK
ncbi:chaperonin 10-like protein [Spinellus fusiger]|nr:chaperonin 10-like protein [Spinellus fusiger]